MTQGLCVGVTVCSTNYSLVLAFGQVHLMSRLHVYWPQIYFLTPSWESCVFSSGPAFPAVWELSGSCRRGWPCSSDTRAAPKPRAPPWRVKIPTLGLPVMFFRNLWR